MVEHRFKMRECALEVVRFTRLRGPGGKHKGAFAYYWGSMGSPLQRSFRRSSPEGSGALTLEAEE